MASTAFAACVVLLCALACGQLAGAQRDPAPVVVAAPDVTVPQFLKAQLEALGYVVQKEPVIGTSGGAQEEEEEEEPVFSQMELDAMLINATKKNDLEGVQMYLELGADLNLTTGVAERTLLHIASKTGEAELIEFLIEAGIDVNAITTGEATPLHVAAADNRVEAAALLLENGADKTATTRDGNSPLHWAATQGHPEVAKLLLDYGADRGALNADGDIPAEILCCCECGLDSNCSCEDRDALVLLLDSTVSRQTTPVPVAPPVNTTISANETEVEADAEAEIETEVEAEIETEIETVLATEDDAVVVPIVIAEAEPPSTL